MTSPWSQIASKLSSDYDQRKVNVLEAQESEIAKS